MDSKKNRQISEATKERLRFYASLQKIKWARWRERIREEAKKEFISLSRDPLFIAGIALYWGEGDRQMKNGLVRLGNTDWRLVYTFIEFLERIAKVPRTKIKLALILYPDLLEEECKRFWSQKCKIPLDQFHKTQFIQGKHPTKKLPYGICNVVVSSRGLKEKIFTWIDLFVKEYL
ncbi:hypothetical protein J7L09_02430 [bacterium]|nr:hypothetical protein [bacterium]